MDNLRFGEWIEDQYKDRGWTQKEFAERVDVRPSTVSNWVTHRSTPEEWICDRIAVVLDVDRNEVRRRANRREVSIEVANSGHRQSTEEEMAGSDDVLHKILDELRRINERLDRQG